MKSSEVGVDVPYLRLRGWWLHRAGFTIGRNLGLTTSFPEMAATFAAVRIGALDLAVGDIVGSNAFNMCILLAMDVVYLKGPVLARRGQRLGVVRIESVLIVLAYAGAFWMLATGKTP